MFGTMRRTAQRVSAQARSFSSSFPVRSASYRFVTGGVSALGVTGLLLAGGMGSTAVLAEETTAGGLPPPAFEPVEGESLADLESGGASRKPRRTTGRATALKPLPNPGKFEELSRECKECLNVDVFGGARFEVNYAPVQQMEKQMAFALSTHMDSFSIPSGSSVDFACNLYTNNSLFIARVDKDMSVMGRFHHSLTPAFTLKSLFQANGEQFSAVGELDYKGQDFYAHAKSTKAPNGVHHSVSFQQSLSECHSVGSELFVQPGAGQYISGAWRYNNVNGQGTGDVCTLQVISMGSASATYTRNVAQGLNLSTELQMQLAPTPTGMPTVESMVQVGALYKYQTFRFQSNLRSDLTMQMALEQQVMPFITVSCNSEINHWTNAATFGLGFRMG